MDFSLPTGLIPRNPRTLGRFNVFILLNGLICLHGSKSVFERTLKHCTLKSVLDRSCVPDPAAGAQDELARPSLNSANNRPTHRSPTGMFETSQQEAFCDVWKTMKSVSAATPPHTPLEELPTLPQTH